MICSYGPGYALGQDPTSFFHSTGSLGVNFFAWLMYSAKHFKIQDCCISPSREILCGFELKESILERHAHTTLHPRYLVNWHSHRQTNRHITLHSMSRILIIVWCIHKTTHNKFSKHDISLSMSRTEGRQWKWLGRWVICNALWGYVLIA